MAVTDEDVKRAKQDAINKRNQERMEREVYPPSKAESPSAKRSRKEAALKDESMLGLYAKEKDIPRKIKDAITGEDDYGTSLSKGAMYAADKAAKEHRSEASGAGKTRGQVDSEAMDVARKAAREAAAEERREARGMKKGGAVKRAKGGSASSRADGCAMRGKTRGKMI